MVKATLKSVLGHKLRLALTALAIVIGVGFVAGTFIFTDTIDKTFDNLFEDAFAGIDVLVQSQTEIEAGFSGPPPFDEAVLADVLDVPGVAAAEGSVTGFAQLVDKQGEPIAPLGPPTLGGSWSEDERLWGNIELREGREPGPGEITVDAATAKGNDLAVGDRVDVILPIGTEEFEIVGIVGFGETDNLAGATFAGFELSEAQRVLDVPGQFHSINVLAEEGSSADALRDQIDQALPDTLEVITAADEAAQQAETLQDSLGFLQTVLLVFAGIAVFVGAFIISNTFRIVVAQRTREMGLLRALGATGRQVVGMVLLESLIVAVVASAIGIGFGLLTSNGLYGLMSVAGFDMPSTSPTLAPRTIVVALAVGIVVTIAAALLPAVRAARITPMAALQEVDIEPTGSLRRRATVGGITLAVGVALIVNGLFGDVIDLGPINELTAVAVGALVVFIGISILSALFVKPLANWIGWPMRRLGKITGKLAQENATRRPRRAAATSSALMIGLALVGFFYILGASIKASTAEAIEDALRGDFIVSSTGFIPTLPPAFTENLQAAPEIEAASPVRVDFFDRDGAEEFVAGIDVDTFDAVADIDLQQGTIEALRGGGVMVFEDLADHEGWTVGDVIEMGFTATGVQQVEIVGIFADQSATQAPFVLAMPTFEENFTYRLDFYVGVKLAEGVPVDQGRAVIEAAAAEFPNAEVRDQVEFREQQEAQIDTLLNVFQGLLFLAVIIALLGITNTLVLSIFERTREIGLLRAVGMSRWQVRRMVLWESIIIAVIGGLFGILVGTFFGAVVVSALGNQGVTTLSIPGAQLATLVVVAIVAGLIASVFPARRAAKLNILEAIAYE